MDSVSFYSFQLIVGNEVPDSDFLARTFSSGEDGISYYGSFYKIKSEVLENRFYWLYFQYGKADPHSDIVWNTDPKEGILSEEDNPRKGNQVEPISQLFSIYDTNLQLLYVSNRKKAGVVREYLNRFSHAGEVLIKNVFVSIEDWTSRIKVLDEVKLTGVKNLFSQDVDVFKGVTDVLGHGDVKRFSIHAELNAPLVERVKERILSFRKKERENEIEELVCVGRDDKGIESTFNLDSFTTKTKIELRKNEQGFFAPEEVREKLIAKLREGADA